MRAVPLSLANPGARGRAASRVWDAPAPLRLWHLASLDAPTVAVVWGLGFAWAAGVKLPAWVPVLLALAAWVVYIGDRLLDARAGLRSGAGHRLRERHRFHWKHRRVLTPLGFAAAIAAACIVFVLMPAAARGRDTVLAAAALVYFTRVHSSPRLAPARFLSPLLTKELLVGVLFTAGCALPAWNRSAGAPWPLVAPVVFFAMLAWLNCHAIERWEAGGSSGAKAPADSADFMRGLKPPPPSGSKFSAGCQAPQFLVAASLLGLAGMLLATGLSFAEPRSAALICAGAASALLLALLDRQRGRLTPLALRAAADLVLLTPLAMLLK